MPKPRRKTLLSRGKRGDMIRVLVDDKRDRVIVHYRDGEGVPRRKFFTSDRNGKAEAIAWAEAYHEVRSNRGKKKEEQHTTLRALWAAYIEAEAPNLREKTIINYRQRFGKWREFMGSDALADDTTLNDIDRFKAAALKSGTVLNQVRAIISVTRIVYNWGQSRKLVHTNEVSIYRWKQPKDARSIEPAQYTEDEFHRLLRQFDPTRHDQWRAWARLMIFGHTAMRSNAVIHLRWSDIDFARGVIRWPGQYMKSGKDHVQPIAWGTYAALVTARQWREYSATVRERDDRSPASRASQLEESDWVIFALRDKQKPYSYTAFDYQLRQAEKKAKVSHLDYRGGHGFRKMVFNQILRDTRDPMTAMAYIGDTDLKILKNYDRLGEERIAAGSAVVEAGR